MTQPGELTPYELRGMQPVLGVPDVHATVALYRDVLGFHVEVGEGGPLVHARVCADPTYFAPTVDIRFEPPRPGTSVNPPAELRVHVGHDRDPLFSTYRSRGVEEPRVRPWGLCQFSIRDCNGYALTFSAESTPER